MGRSAFLAVAGFVLATAGTLLFSSTLFTLSPICGSLVLGIILFSPIYGAVMRYALLRRPMRWWAYAAILLLGTPLYVGAVILLGSLQMSLYW